MTQGSIRFNVVLEGKSLSEIAGQAGEKVRMAVMEKVVCCFCGCRYLSPSLFGWSQRILPLAARCDVTKRTSQRLALEILYESQRPVPGPTNRRRALTIQ